MNYYFITGTSKGIGKALAELLLEGPENFVFGISRTQTIKHTNYVHFAIDLNRLQIVKDFTFPEFEDAGKIVLVNNSIAGSEILHFENANNDRIVTNYNIDLLAPAILCNNFLKAYQKFSCERMIINMSSGAAFRPIESWAVYCSSKAGLLMLSEVIDVEQKLYHKENPVHIFSFSPGVVDTDAQVRIRSTKKENFSMVDTFINYKENNQLAQPEDVAKKIKFVIDNPEKFEKVQVDVKSISL